MQQENPTRDYAKAHPHEYLATFPSRLPLQIRFSDVDRMGHVNNSVHQQFFDLGRLAYFDGLLTPTPDWGGTVVILAHLDVDFLQPLLLSSEANIFTRTLTDSFAEKSFVMEQAIGAPDGSCVYSLSRSLMVGYDGGALRSTALPEAWVTQIKDYEVLTPDERVSDKRSVMPDGRR